MIDLRRGDCIEVMRTLPSESVHAIVTDPPYGTEYKSGRQGVDRERSNRREGDIVVRESYFSQIANDESLPTEWISEAFRVLASGSALYVFCHWKKWGELECAVSRAGFDVKNMIVLNKSNHGMGDLKGSYAPKHELLMFATKGRHLMRFPNGRINDVWDVPVKFSGAIRLHPNEKPVSWYIPAIENSTDAGQVVLDPFMGSGTCGEACVDTGRNFIGIELDESYYAVAQKRMGVQPKRDPKAMRKAGMSLGEIARLLKQSIPEVARQLK